jgi:ATP synthase protein I
MTSDLDDLQSRIKQARIDGVGDEPPAPPKADIQNRNQGVKAGTELVSSMVAGGLLGYAIDKWFETGPWGFMICLILGIFTGFWTLYRSLKNMGSEVGFTRLQTPEKPGKETQRFSGTSVED